ncbi:hypothetical protein, partial [Klebsiella pneumoniae]|uniref:hypothetical protein n=1 Tax=Klebsiella pneumoniae TaxID=573 RepID=UPI0025A0132C
PDLASGPRTVVDVLKLACSRFAGDRGRETGDGAGPRPPVTPFGLLDLVGAFERGEVAFDGIARIRTAVQQALGHELVRG